MINQQLLDYVRSQRSAGLSKEAVSQALAAGGWTANDVNEAWMAIDGVVTPPPPPPPPPPQPAAPRQIIPPVQPAAPMQQPTSAIPQPQVIIEPTIQARPRVAMSEFSTAPARVKRRGSGILTVVIVLLIIILLGLGGIFALAYFNPTLATQYIPQLQMFFPTQPAPQAPDTTALDLNTPPPSDTSLVPGTTSATNTPSGAASSSVQ